MGKHLKKAQDRLDERRKQYDAMSREAKDSMKRPGSMKK